MTPVEVSLCGHAYTSTPASAVGGGEGSGLGLDDRRVAEERARSAVTEPNFAENSPKLRCWARSRTRPNAAMSQNAVEPPLPRTIS